MLLLEDAQKMIEAALHKARELGIKVSVAVVDPGGHLVALSRMDGAPWGDIDFAINKAYSAAAWKVPTAELTEDGGSGGQFYGMHFSNHFKVVTFRGGAPLFSRGVIAGAVGVSGGTLEEDQQCLDAAAAAYDPQAL